MEVHAFHEAINAIGRVPVERTTTYGRVTRSDASIA